MSLHYNVFESGLLLAHRYGGQFGVDARQAYVRQHDLRQKRRKLKNFRKKNFIILVKEAIDIVSDRVGDQIKNKRNK